jgi:hypothetical protein
MGGASSSTNVSVATSAAVNAMAKSIMNCQSNSVITQTFTVSGDYNVLTNIKQVQYLKLSSSCAQNAQNVSDIQQAVSAALQSAASSQSEALLGVLGSSSSDVNQNIHNDVTQNITQETVMNVINQTNAQQAVVISGNHNIIDKFEQSQTQDILFNNCQTVLNQLKSTQAIENAAAGSATAVQKNPISEIVDSVFGGLASFGWMWVIIIVVGLIVGGYILLKGGPISAILHGDGNSNNGNNSIQPPPYSAR